MNFQAPSSKKVLFFIKLRKYKKLEIIRKRAFSQFLFTIIVEKNNELVSNFYFATKTVTMTTFATSFGINHSDKRVCYLRNLIFILHAIVLFTRLVI